METENFFAYSNPQITSENFFDASWKCQQPIDLMIALIPGVSLPQQIS